MWGSSQTSNFNKTVGAKEAYTIFSFHPPHKHFGTVNSRELRRVDSQKLRCLLHILRSEKGQGSRISNF